MWTVIACVSFAYLLHINNAAIIPNLASRENVASNHGVLDVVNWTFGEIRNGSRWIRQSAKFLGIFQPDGAHQDCTTLFGRKGKCRHFQHCVFRHLRTIDVITNSTCIISGRYVGVCCPEGQEKPMPSPGGLPGSEDAGQLPAIDPGLPASGTGNATTTPATESSFAAPAPDLDTPEVRGCGVSTVMGARIVGGQPAAPKEWPWMAALLRSRTEQFCGGVLITDQHILTAAHCLTRHTAKDITVRLGEYDLGLKNDTRSQDFQVTDIRMHKDFSKSTYEHDIAILKLGTKTAFNSYIWPVCLPTPGVTFENRIAMVAGWGTVSYGGPASDVLMEVSVPVWNHQKCKERFSQPIPETALCAGAYEGGKDSCQGDSGGPLMLQLDSGRWAVIGVVSWGIRCAQPNTPGIYTRVNKYIQWIVRNTD